MKKKISWLLILLLTFSLVSFAEDDYSEPIEITWMIPTQQSISLGESIPVKKLLEKFNITVNWIELNPVDQHPEKLNLLLASRQLPDIISWVDKDYAARYGAEGAFLEITPYLKDYFPNIAGVLEREASSYYVSYTLDDKLWYIPTWTRTAPPNWGWSINQEAFAEVGYPIEKLKSFDDFKAALVLLKKAYPDSFPLVSRTAEFGISNFLSSFVIPFTRGMTGYGIIGFDYDSKEWKINARIDGYKEALMYIHGLYQEGLLDPEFITCDMNTLITLFAEKKGFATADFVGGLSGVGDVQNQVNNVLYPIEWPSPVQGVESIMGSKAIPIASRGTVLPAEIVNDEAKFARVSAMLDFMYSDEWYDLFYNNPDVLEGEGPAYVKAYYERKDNLRDLYFPWGIFANFQDDPLREDVEPGTPWADFCIRWGNEYASRLTENVIMPFDSDTQSEINDITNTVTDYWNANVMQFVIGRTSFDDWDAFVAGMMDAGGTELESIYNASYNEFYGK